MMNPVRKVVSRSKGRVNGYYYSRKARRLLPWESQLERDALIIVDLMPEVDQVAVQPFKLVYQCDGRDRIYFPDILIQGSFGETVIEVKASGELRKPDNQKRFPLIEATLAENGYRFEIWTEQDIRREPRRKNLGLLSAYRLCEPPAVDKKQLRSLFRGCPHVSIQEVADLIGGDADLADVLLLVANGQLKIDLDARIGLSTPVELVRGGLGQ